MTAPNPTLESPLVYGKEASAAAAGMSEIGVRRIADVFERQLADGLHPGAQLVVLRHGHVAVDRAAGLVDVRRRLPVTPETPFLTWSCSKALTGMCVHRLIEEGKVEMDAPVARYWPEFGCNGKESATIRHTFLHQAGIPTRGLYRMFPYWSDWDRVTRTVAALRAQFPPGSCSSYHYLNYGFILGEVVRRVTGQPIQEYLRRTFLAPLGMAGSSLGLPRDQRDRAARIYSMGPEQRLAVFGFGLPHARSAVLPAASLNSTARDLAVFYQMLINGGLYAGRRNLAPETIAVATAVGYEGLDAKEGTPVRWAYGFHLGGLLPGSPYPGPEDGKGSTARTFGHNGQASCMVWADPDAQLVVAFLCNGLQNRAVVHARWAEISDAAWDALSR